MPRKKFPAAVNKRSLARPIVRANKKGFFYAIRQQIEAGNK